MALSFFRCLIIFYDIPIFDSQISFYGSRGFCIYFMQLASCDYSGRVGPTLWRDQPVVTNIWGWRTHPFSWVLSTLGSCPASVTQAPALELAHEFRAMLLDPHVSPSLSPSASAVPQSRPS